MKNNASLIMIMVVFVVGGSLSCLSTSQRQSPPGPQVSPQPILGKASQVFEVKQEEIPAFLEFVGKRGWYAHQIISVDNDAKTMVVRDGIGHDFTLNFDFAEGHLRADHHLGRYIDEMGLYNFLVFAMENNLYEHEIGPVTPEEEVVLIYGDRGTEFATEFYMTFEKIIKHMQRDHKWTNQELLDAGYCEQVFSGPDVERCIKRLTE